MSVRAVVLSILLSGSALAQTFDYAEIRTRAETPVNGVACTEPGSIVYISLDRHIPARCVSGFWVTGWPCTASTSECVQTFVNETANPTCDGTDYWFGFVSGVVSICIDDTVYPLEFTYCISKENVAAATDSYEFFMPAQNVKVTKLYCHCIGTCTTEAVFRLENRDGVAMTHAATACSDGPDTSVPVAVTAANLLGTGQGLSFDVTNTPNPETDEYTICIGYRFSD